MARTGDGDNDYLWNTGNCGISNATALTIHIWGKASSLTPSDNRALSANWGATPATGEFLLRLQNAADDVQAFIFTSVTSYGGNVGKTVTDTNWHSYALVWDGSELSGWLDASKGGTTFTTAGTFGNSSSDTAVGADIRDTGASGNSAWEGDYAEAAFYTATLTQEELTTLSLGYSPLLVRPSSLVAYWPIIGRTSPEIDIVGGFGMTLNNAPPTADHPSVIYPSTNTGLWISPPSGAVYVPRPAAMSVSSLGVITV